MTDNAPETQQAQPETGIKGKLSSLWRSKAMTPVRFAFWMSSPVWWPAKQATKAALWGLKRQNTYAKLGVPFLAAAAFTAYAYAGSYAAVYGVVAAGDYYWFGKPYSTGERVGRIAKLSVVGKFPCDTIEGELAMPNLGTGGSSTFAFSARTLGPINADIVAQLKKAYEEGYPVSLTYKQSHFPKEMFDREKEGWFFPHLSGFSCYQKTDYNIVEVTPKPNAEVPVPPRFPEGRQP